MRPRDATNDYQFNLAKHELEEKLLFVCKNRVAFKKFQTSRIPSFGLDLLIFVKIFEISLVTQTFYALDTDSACSLTIGKFKVMKVRTRLWLGAVQLRQWRVGLL